MGDDDGNSSFSMTNKSKKRLVMDKLTQKALMDRENGTECLLFFFDL
jgi:hypothetical protein